ncbi:MAG: hypothetical protein ABI760_13350 [Ferruginibacter sp.]
MKTVSKRMILCTKDIMMITGKGERTARRIAAFIKKEHNAPYVTVDAICRYMRLKEEKIMELLYNY